MLEITMAVVASEGKREDIVFYKISKKLVRLSMAFSETSVVPSQSMARYGLSGGCPAT